MLLSSTMPWLYDFDDSNPDALFDSDPDNDNAFSKPEPDPDDDMPLLPKNFYITEKEMIDNIQVWSALHYYAFQKGRSKTISKDCKKLLY
jgi:hypothetical protein